MRFTIKQARAYAGFTQTEMAEKLGIHRSTYMKIENDPSLATIGQIFRISEITGIGIEQFFLGNNSTNVEHTA